MTEHARRLRVAITGAEGIIGGVLRASLSDRYDFINTTRTPVEFESTVVDIRDVDGLTAALRGSDAVVHLAALADAGGDWQGTLEHNIIGMRNVYEAALQAGVPRVVFASSNHAVAQFEVDASPTLYDLDDTRTIGTDCELRPDSLYGWSKAAGETLGRFYSDVHGLQVICLRIGWVLRVDDLWQQDMGVEVAPPLAAADVARRARAIWLSHRDCASLIDAALRTDVRFGVYYGVSNNPRSFYDMQPGQRDLGWMPEDSAPATFAEPGATRPSD